VKSAVEETWMIGQSQIQRLEELKRSSIRWISSHGLGLPEAEDIFQHSLLKAISSPSSVEEPEKLTAWFYQILRNTLTDEFRKMSAQKKWTQTYALEVLPTLDAETETILCRCLEGMMEELSALERNILEGHFFEGKKFKTLSQEFGQSEGSIRVKALRARDKLKEALRACCNITRFEQVKDCGCKS
jgi:RNA polymerase sigma-70 factor (ECF subfamily)